MLYQINVAEIAQRLSKGNRTYSIGETCVFLKRTLDAISVEWGIELSDFDPYFYCLKDDTHWLQIELVHSDNPVYFEGRLDYEIRKTVAIQTANDEKAFLKLNADPDYYRFNLFCLLTHCQWSLLDADLSNFESACKEVAEYLAIYRDIEVEWGYGSAEHDKGTEFEYNKGYYLFFKAPNKAVGERIEAEVIRYFDNHGPCVPDDVAIEMDY